MKNDNNSLVLINRDSVAAGDDMESREHAFKISSGKVNLETLFKEIIESGYFPLVAGNDVEWILTYNNQRKISWNTKNNTFTEHKMMGSSLILNSEDLIRNGIYFLYEY